MKPITGPPQKERPKTSIALSQKDQLAIGDVSVGVRPLKGLSGKIKSTTTIQTATEMKAAFSIHPTNDISGIMSSRTIKIEHDQKTSRSNLASPARSVATTPKSTRTEMAREYNPNDYETIRITNVQYEAKNKTPRSTVSQPPLVQPPSRSYVNCDPMSTTPRQPPAMIGQSTIDEFKKITSKLRETIAKQNVQIDEKDSQIVELKKKLAEALRQVQQSKVDIIRAEDKRKRALIRYENVQNRLDIAMKELGFKEETISDLKREIIKLKSMIPSEEMLNKLKNAREEQKKLQREARQQKELLELSQHNLTGEKNESVRKHLLTLMENTKKSLNRNEAKRRMWKEVERKQVMGALNALSLIASEPVDTSSFLYLLNKSQRNQGYIEAYTARSRAQRKLHNSDNEDFSTEEF